MNSQVYLRFAKFPQVYSLKPYIMILFTKQKQSHRKQRDGYQVERRSRDSLGDWDGHILAIIYKIDKNLFYRPRYSITVQ